MALTNISKVFCIIVIVSQYLTILQELLFKKQEIKERKLNARDFQKLLQGYLILTMTISNNVSVEM